jgi:hypothetical protein
MEFGQQPQQWHTDFPLPTLDTRDTLAALDALHRISEQTSVVDMIVQFYLQHVRSGIMWYT